MTKELSGLPFCTNCGTRVDDRAAFCSYCGMRQPHTNPQPQVAPQATDILDNISNRTASMLCYVPVFGVIPAIVFLASHKFRQNGWVRFDAFQSLYLFVAWLLLSSAIPTLLHTGFGLEHVLYGLLRAALFICWIYLLVKAAHNQQVRVPIVGDLAARSALEQL